MQFEKGPHIRAALICETVIERKDGVLSLVNIVDRIEFQARGVDPPTEMPPYDLNVNLVLMLTADQTRGAHAVKLELEGANGSKQELGSQDLHMEPGRMQNLIAKLNLQLDEPGRYWIWVYFNDQPMTKVQFDLIYLRAQANAR
ncbi:MAG: hypothetical protein OXE05_05650 [Chloroflexi bacterium]|nr:hypothetical protein [Chloroflexota bacterium]